MSLESFVTCTFEIVSWRSMVVREMTMTVIETRMMVTWIHLMEVTMSWTKTGVVNPTHTTWVLIIDYIGVNLNIVIENYFYLKSA